MHGKKKGSNITRFTILITHFALIIFIAWIYFGNGSNLIASLLNLSIQKGDITRLTLLFSFSLIYFLRFIFTLFVFLKREIGWGETGGIIFALAFYQLGFTFTGMFQHVPLDWIDLIPIGIFILGSYLNTYSEYQRMQFKKKPENQGKLYTQGLFKYAQHINYFGEFVWILGFAFLTRNPWALIMPLFCVINFVFFNIPTLDKYLQEKYGEQYQRWNKNTKKFIPFIY
jgi:protein-S-isoprenylcysteine O-methyltransferase Ste14